MTIIKIMQRVLSEVPQFRSRGLCPVLPRSLGGEKINWISILRVHWNVSIQFTQFAQSVVNITIVVHFHGTHLASIQEHRNVVFLFLLLLVGWIIERIKTVKPFIRKTANQIKECH